MEHVAKNFLVKINTNYTEIANFDAKFIQNWKSLITNKDILNFILYKIVVDQENGCYDITAYVELKKYYRITSLVNLFTLNNNVFVNPRPVKVRQEKDKLYLKNILDEKENLFWFGKPRSEGKVISPLNFRFIIENNLLKKARNNSPFPLSWVDTEINELKIKVNSALLEFDVKKEDFNAEKQELPTNYLEICKNFKSKINKENLINSSKILFSYLEKEQNLEVIYKFVNRNKRAEIFWDGFFKFFDLDFQEKNREKTLTSLSFKSIETLKNNIRNETAVARKEIKKRINLDLETNYN